MYRIGCASDIHALIEGRALVLGGVLIPSTKGAQAHSDGDVLLHAIVEAILGALGLGDLGDHFSDKEERYQGIASTYFVEQAKHYLTLHGYSIVNLDTTIALEVIRLEPYKKTIREHVASLLSLKLEQVNIKAATNEKMDAVGKGEALLAQAVVLLRKEEVEEYE